MSSLLREKKSALLRIWHWTNMLAIFGLLGTAILRKTFMSWRNMSAIIDTKMAEAGTAITPELAKDIAIGIRTPMWENHYILGIILAVLLVLRIAIALIPGKSNILKNFREAIRHKDLHALGIKATYIIFYGILVIMVVSGMLMYFQTELSLSKDFVNMIKERHESFLWIITGFVVLHIIGVFVTELMGEKGMVSRMIHGDDH